MATATKPKPFDSQDFEKIIKNGEVSYKAIDEDQTELIYRFNSTKNLIFVNDSYCRYFRKKRQDLIGHSFLAFIHEKDRQKSEKLISSLNRKNPVVTTEYRVKLPGGDIRWQQWSIWAIFDVKGIRVEYQAVGRDLTERIMAERALRASEKNFRALAENAYDGIMIVAENGSIVYVNNRLSEITGYRVNELCRLRLADICHPAEVQKATQWHRLRLEGQPVPPRDQTIFRKKDGVAFLVEVTDSKTVWLDKPAVLKIMRDITLRTRIEETLGKVHNELERRVKEQTKKLLAAGEELERKQKELLRHRKDLEKASQELVQTNTALSVLARNIDKKRDAVEKKIARTISARIMPLVEELQADKIPESSRAKLEVLSVFLKNLTPDTAKGLEIIVSFSTMELRVATMIKNNFSSNQISRLLHLSLHTVKTHRRSIRKKLNINNSKINLTSYLKQRLG
jgi:PAS domain S-box-containing protein